MNKKFISLTLCLILMFNISISTYINAVDDGYISILELIYQSLYNGTDIESAIDEYVTYNNLSMHNPEAIKAVIDDGIYDETGLLIVEDTEPDNTRVINGEAEILGETVLGNLITNPNFPVDVNTGDPLDVDRNDYLYWKNNADVDIMKKNDKVGNTIDEKMILNNKYLDLKTTNPEYADEIYAGFIVGLYFSNSLSKSDDFKNAFYKAFVNYIISGDMSVFRDVTFTDTRHTSTTPKYDTIGTSYSDYEVPLDELFVIQIFPTEHSSGRAIVLRDASGNGASDWYFGVTIPPLGTMRSLLQGSSIIDVTGNIEINNTITSTTTSIDGTVDFEINSTEQLSTYEIYDISSNTMINGSLTGDLTNNNSTSYSASIPITVNTPTNITDISITIKGSDIDGNSDITTVTATIGKTVASSSMDINSSSIIKADTRDAESYDVSDGIPTTENLYINVFSAEYLFEEEYTPVTGEIDYTVNVTKQYYYKWETSESEDKNGDGDTSDPGEDWDEDHSDTNDLPVTQTFTVTRDYLYYLIERLEVYELTEATITNGALPGGILEIKPDENYYYSPNVSFIHSNEESDHIQGATYKSLSKLSSDFDSISYDSTTGEFNVILTTETVGGGSYSSKPDTPDEDFEDYAEDAIGEIQVKNDHLEFNGAVILDGSDWEDGETETPGNIPSASEIGDNVLYQNNLTIDEALENDNYMSTGTISYARIAEINPLWDTTIEENITAINNVIVHTPVVCDGGILSLSDYNQEITPDTSRASLILGKSTIIRLLTTGNHLSIKGYGMKDYVDYTKTKQIRFPFDVYVDTDYREDGKYLTANTWYDIPLDQNLMDIYIPIWVAEGDYEVEYRTIAINNGDDTVEEGANLDRNNYIATDSSPVRVIGRVYGFRITDITDYEVWDSVFRVDEGISHSDNYYLSGEKDENGELIGIDETYTLPIMNGSYLEYDNYGAIKTGYEFKFEITGLGDYENEQDCIAIYPNFYYVSYDGSNKQEVDLYYHEYFNDQTNYFVKIDSDYNRDNTKYIELGNPYRNVSDIEIEDTSNVLGISETEMKYQEAKLGWLDFIVVSQPIRTFIGNTENLPETIDEDDVLQSQQKWYGEYYLPNDTYVAPLDYDVIEYGRINNGLDGSEDFWLTEGYIIVNFEIVSVKDGDFDNPILSYRETTLSNMWEIEGYDLTKDDNDGNNYDLEYGDVIFYYTDKKASDDYN